MEKIKVGLLPLYIKLYDDFGTNRTLLEEFNSLVVEKLEKAGLEVISAPICRIKDEFNSAVENFEKNNAKAIITLHLAYSPSLESIDALCSTELPIIVMDTTKDMSLSSEYSKSPIGSNHGIHGVMDMCNLLKRRGKKYVVVAGHLENSNVLKNTVDCVKTCVSAKALNGLKVRSFGGSFAGMGDFIIENKDLKEKLGVQAVEITNDEMLSAVNSITENEIKDEIEFYKNNFLMAEEIDLVALKLSVKACLATRKIIKEKGLDAFSVNFLGVSKNNLGNMPFIEACLQMANGIGYSGEGDILTASFVGALLKYIKDVSFVEIFCPDWKENRLLISHMGEMNFNLLREKPVLSTAPFRYSDAGSMAKAVGAFKEGKAVYCNVFRVENEKFVMSVSEVEVSFVEGQVENSVRGWITPNMNIAKFLEKLSEHGAIHHGFLVYDVDVKAMKCFGQTLNMEVVEI